MQLTRTIEWHNGAVLTVDQTRLPDETAVLEMKSCEEVAEAIKTMKIRGAPLLGAAAAYALALTAHHSKAKTEEELVGELEKAANILRATRPTAVNLFWAIDRILGKAKGFVGNAEALSVFVVEEAQKIVDRTTREINDEK